MEASSEPDFLTAILARLQHEEGLRLRPYRDTTGHLTIGYGHNLDNGINRRQAWCLLKEDVMDAIAELDKAKPWWRQLPFDARVVVLDMQFNLGWPKFQSFRKFWGALEAGEYVRAAHEMRDSVWYGQVKGRAEQLAKLMEGVGLSGNALTM